MSWAEYNRLRDEQDKAVVTASPVTPVRTPPSSSFRRIVGDTGVSAVKAAVGFAETPVGIADLVTGGRVGKAIEDYTPIQFKKTRDILETMYTPEQQAANRKVQQADGFVDTVSTAVANPSTIYHAAVENLPGMFGGRAIAQKLVSGGLAKFAPKWGASIAGGAGEAAITAGQNVEQVRQQTPDRLINPTQAGILGVSSLVTGAIGVGVGKFAGKVGLADPDIVGGTAGKTLSMPRRVLGGMVTEGPIEEGTQSAQEAMASNLALDKPLMEGVGNAVGMGSLVGGVMGGSTNLITKPPTAQELTDDMNAALLRRIETGEGGAVDHLESVVRERLNSLLTGQIPRQAGAGVSALLDAPSANRGNLVVNPEAPLAGDAEATRNNLSARQVLQEQQAAERQAAFDTANPVIPNAPEGAVQPVTSIPGTEFTPAPSTINEETFQAFHAAVSADPTRAAVYSSIIGEANSITEAERAANPNMTEEQLDQRFREVSVELYTQALANNDPFADPGTVAPMGQAPAQTVYATMPLTEVSREASSRELDDAAGWNAAVQQANSELGSTTLSQAYRRAFEIHDAALGVAPAAPAGTALNDPLNILPNQTAANETPLQGADVDAYNTLMASDTYEATMRQAEANLTAQGYDTNTASNPLASSAVRNEALRVSLEAAPARFSAHLDTFDNTYIVRDNTTGDIIADNIATEGEANTIAQLHVGMNGQNAAPAAPAAQADPLDSMSRMNLLQLRDTLDTDEWNTAVRQVNPRYVEITDDMLRQAIRIVQGQTAPATQTAPGMAPIPSWLANHPAPTAALPTEIHEQLRAITSTPGGTERLDLIDAELEQELNAAGLSAMQYNNAMTTEGIRIFNERFGSTLPTQTTPNSAPLTTQEAAEYNDFMNSPEYGSIWVQAAQNIGDQEVNNPDTEVRRNLQRREGLRLYHEQQGTQLPTPPAQVTITPQGTSTQQPGYTGSTTDQNSYLAWRDALSGESRATYDRVRAEGVAEQLAGRVAMNDVALRDYIVPAYNAAVRGQPFIAAGVPTDLTDGAAWLGFIQQIRGNQASSDLYDQAVAATGLDVTNLPQGTSMLNYREDVINELGMLAGIRFATAAAQPTSTPATSAPITVVDPANPTHDELKAIVTAPVSTAEANAMDAVRNLLRTSSQSTTETTIEKGLSKIWGKIKTRVSSFRWGGTNNDTFTTISNAINRQLAADGQPMKVRFAIKVNGESAYRGNPRLDTLPGGASRIYSISPQFQLEGDPRWHGHDVFYRAGGANFMATSQRLDRAKIGGLFYYMGQLAAKNMADIRISSGGMTAINQQRRAENAFSFLARYGSLEGTTITFSGDNNLTASTTNKFSMLLTNLLATDRSNASYQGDRMRGLINALGRYTYDFTNKVIREKTTGTIIPVRYLTAQARRQGDTLEQRLNDNSNHVGSSSTAQESFSDASIERMIINLTAVDRMRNNPSQAEIDRMGREILSGSLMFPPILYNRVGDVEVSGLKATELETQLADIAAALGTRGVPVRVIQSMQDMPGFNPDMPIFNAALHEGAIYVVADYVTSATEAKKLILDHEVRHLGLRTLLGEAGLDSFLKRTWFAHREKVTAFGVAKGIITDGNGKDSQGIDRRLEAAEEYIVSLAQEAKSSSLLDRAITVVRNALRSLGINLALSRSELRDLVSRAGSEFNAPANFFERFMAKWNVEPSIIRAPTPVTMFSRTEPTRIPFTQAQAAETVNKLLNSTVWEKVKAAGSYLYTHLAPQDRIINSALAKPTVQFISKQLKLLQQYLSEQATTRTDILHAAQTQATNIEKHAKKPEDMDNINKTFSLGTLYGIYPNVTENHPSQDWNAATWTAEKQHEKHGKTYAEAYKEVNDAYKSLPSEMKQEYVNTIRMMADLHDRLRKGMLSAVEETTPETTPENSTGTRTVNGIVQLVGERERQQAAINKRFHYVKGPYMPLSRFGSHAVTVFKRDANDPDGIGERIEMRKFEYETEAKAFQQAMIAQGYLASKGLDQEFSRVKSEIPTGFLSQLSQTLADQGITGETAANIEEQFYRIWASLSPELNATRYNLKRTGLAGFDEDMVRGFLQSAQAHGSTIGFFEKGFKVRQQFLEIDTLITSERQPSTDRPGGRDVRDAEALMNTIRTNTAKIHNERVENWVQQATKLPFVWYLASPSVALVQSAQPFMVAAPAISVKYGIASSLATISKHYGRQMSMKGGTLTYSNERIEKHDGNAKRYLDILAMQEVTPAEKAAKTTAMKSFQDEVKNLSEEEQTLLGMKIATKWGAIDITLANDAMDYILHGGKSSSGKAMHYASYFMRTSEIMSRKATFAAAFDLAMSKGGKDFNEATQYATKIVKDTLFNYDKSNRPVALLGAGGRLLGQFRIFQLHYATKIVQLASDSFAKPFEGESEADFKTRRSEARQELGTNLMMSMLLAGVHGLPIPMMFTFINFIAAAFGDDDEPFDAEVMFDNAMSKVPLHLGDAFGKGIFGLVGWDVSRRIGAGAVFDIINGEPPENLKGKALTAWYALKLAGPTGGVVGDLTTLAGLLKEGDVSAAMQSAAPKIIKDLSRAVSVGTGNDLVNSSGRLTIKSEEVNAAEVALMAIGINPLDVSLAVAKGVSTQKMSTKIAARKSEIVKDFADAIEADDYDARMDAIAAVSKFNQTNREFGITGSDVREVIVAGIRKRAGLPTKMEAKVQRRFELGTNEEETED